MKKLLIIKTGSTFPSISKEYGDFEDFIINQLDMSRDAVIVSDVLQKQTLPELKDIYGIIITGSHSMVTDYEEWSVKLSKWLRKLMTDPVPTLGICYGHQLLADAFGGKVGYHPKGRELGEGTITVTEEGKKDKLFENMPEKFPGYVAHSQTVLELPAGSVILAQNDFEKHHGVLFHDKIWGVQFHPEFNAGITNLYIEETRQYLDKQGQNSDHLSEPVGENEYGKLFLQRFMEII